jgi:hypothetical protein
VLPESIFRSAKLVYLTLLLLLLLLLLLFVATDVFLHFRTEPRPSACYKFVRAFQARCKSPGSRISGATMTTAVFNVTIESHYSYDDITIRNFLLPQHAGPVYNDCASITSTGDLKRGECNLLAYSRGPIKAHRTNGSASERVHSSAQVLSAS